jgi:hypothetical protein
VNRAASKVADVKTKAKRMRLDQFALAADLRSQAECR